jgi:hypothetical protein
MGRNHSDNSLVVSVPGQKVIYAANWLPLGELIWRNVIDSYIDEWFTGIDRAPNEVKLPKYQQLFQYDAFLPMNVDRMCLYWRNGWQ